MSWKLANSLVGSLAAILFVTTIFAACKGPTGAVGASTSWGGFNLEFFLSNDGKTHWEVDGGPLCVCIEFLDKDNNVIGSGTISGGSGAGSVNGRATMWRAKQIDCADLAKCGAGSGSGGGGGGGSGGGGSGGGGVDMGESDDAPIAREFDPLRAPLQSHQGTLQTNRQWQRVWCGTIEIDETNGGGLIHNGSGAFEVFVVDPNSDEAFLAIWPILQVGPGAPVPPNVKVGFLSQCLPETFGGRMVFARRAPFISFVAHVNGQNNYSVLGLDAVDLTIGNGWHIIEVVVPLSDMNLTPGAANHVQVLSQAAGEITVRDDRGSSVLLP